MKTLLTEEQLQQVRTKDGYRFTLEVQSAMNHTIIALRENNYSSVYEADNALRQAKYVGDFKDYVKNMEHATGDSEEVSAYFAALIATPIAIAVKSTISHLKEGRVGNTKKWFLEPNMAKSFVLDYEDAFVEFLAALKDLIETSISGTNLVDDFLLAYGAMKLAFNEEIHVSNFREAKAEEVANDLIESTRLAEYQVSFLQKILQYDEECYEVYCNLVDIPNATATEIVKSLS